MTEHKKAFFALYFGQDVFLDNMNFKVEGIDVLRDSWIQGIHAELKMLSEISEEDNDTLTKASNKLDFLRSKGYVAPFLEYSVDELVKAGWVKLTKY